MQDPNYQIFNYTLYTQIPNVTFTLTDEKAVVPTKGTSYSVGYDLTAVSIHSKVGRTTFYNTHVIVEPPSGFYTEIVPRSSLAKTGYTLANSVGIIDPDYRGNLLIALMKVDDSLPDLQLPFCKCQLILRKYEDFIMTQTNINNLSTTVRADGGFGSTDKKT